MVANFCRNVDRFYSSFGDLNYAAIGQNLSTKSSFSNYAGNFKNELDFSKYKSLYKQSKGDLDNASSKKNAKDKKLGAFGPIPRSRRKFIWKMHNGPEGWIVKKIKTPEFVFKSKTGNSKATPKVKKVKENLKKKKQKKVKKIKIKKPKLEKLKSTKSGKNLVHKLEKMNNKSNSGKKLSNAKKNITDIIRNEFANGVNISIDDTISRMRALGDLMHDDFNSNKVNTKASRLNNLISIENSSPNCKTDCNYLTKRNKIKILNNEFSLDMRQEKKNLFKKNKSTIELESDSKSVVLEIQKDAKQDKTDTSKISSKSIPLDTSHQKYTISSVKPVKNKNFSDHAKTLVLHKSNKKNDLFFEKKKLATTEKHIYDIGSSNIVMVNSYLNEENTISIGKQDSSLLSPIENYNNSEKINV